MEYDSDYYAQLVLDALKSIDPDEQQLKNDYGICDAISDIIYKEKLHVYFISNKLVKQVLRPIFIKWPEYSRNQVFPVPSPDKTISAHAYYMSAGREQMWSASHPYGASRRRLLKFCIETLEAQLCSTHQP